MDEFDAAFAGADGTLGSGHGVGVIDRDGGTAVEVDHLHGGYVGLPITHVDEVGEGHGTFVFRYRFVNQSVIVGVVDAFIDAEEELGFVGVVDTECGPASNTVLIILKSRGIDGLEILSNAGTFHDFAQSGRDDEVLQMEILFSSVCIDTVEIGLHSFEKGDLFAIFFERTFPNIKVLLFRFDQHQVHVGEHLVHVVLLGHLIGFLPKLTLVHVEVRYEVVLLHVARSQRSIEVIGNRHVSVFCNHFCISRLSLVFSFLFITAKIIIIGLVKVRRK